MNKCYTSYLVTMVKGVLSLIRSTAYIATGVNLFLNRTFIHKINPTNMLAISDVSISQSKMRKVYIYKHVYHFIDPSSYSPLSSHLKCVLIH